MYSFTSERLCVCVYREVSLCIFVCERGIFLGIFEIWNVGAALRGSKINLNNV